MPKRISIGTSLGLLSRFTKKNWSFAPNRPAREPLRRAAMEVLEERLLMSRSWYVAPTGSNGAAGTLAQPFQTIEQAANVAGSGDTVYIEGGTYRETVKPANSGVTFTNYNGQAVTLSGTDPVSGFSSYSGNIHKANMPENLGDGNNQVFVNGAPVNEARWPNTGTDLLHPTQAAIGSYSNNTIYDSALTQSNGYWAGATIHITPGAQWVGYTGTVTNSGPGWISVSLPSTGSMEQPAAGNPFYLTGKFQALDNPGEWYRDNGGSLYLWGTKSENPNSDTVEVKAREYAFDLSNVSNTTIQGVNIFAAAIHTGYSSSNTVINGITASYLTQFNSISTGWWTTAPQGIELYGNNSTLENSTIQYSAGDGVFVNGSNVTVTNNVIHDVDSSGTDDAAVRIYGPGANVNHNNIYNTGRDGINIQTSGSNISYNVIHDAMLLTQDGGGIYTVNMNGQGATIANNYLYNINAGGFGATGIFLDNNSSNFNVHDNTTINVGTGIRLNFSSYNEHVYNNQFGANNWSVESNASPGQSYDWSGTQFYNNTYYKPNYQMGSGVSSWGNVNASGSPSAPNVQVPTATTPPVESSPTPTPVQTPPDNSSSGGVLSSSGGSAVAATSTIQATNYAGIYLASSPYGVVGYTANGAWAEYTHVDFGSGVSSFKASVSLPPANAGQQIVLHLDSPTGQTIGTLVTASTGGWNNYQVQTANVSGAAGVHNLYVAFAGNSAIANLASFSFASSSPAQTPTYTGTSQIQATTYTGIYLASSPYGVIGYTTNGAWAEYANVNLGSGAARFLANMSLPYANAGGQLVLHLDSPTGPTIGSLVTAGTGGWNNYQTETTTVSNATGVHDLYVVFTGNGAIANLNWFQLK